MDLIAIALHQFRQCKDSGMNHHGLLLKNTNSPSKYTKTLLKTTYVLEMFAFLTTKVLNVNYGKAK